MDTMITLNDLLRFLLYVAGIGALIFLMLALKNVAGVFKGREKIGNPRSRHRRHVPKASYYYG